MVGDEKLHRLTAYCSGTISGAIWEGDIVAEQENGEYRIRDVGEVQYREAICGYAIVYFKRGKMYIDPFKEGKQSYNDGWCTIDWVMEYEVLDNIYDNKELIKEG